MSRNDKEQKKALDRLMAARRLLKQARARNTVARQARVPVELEIPGKSPAVAEDEVVVVISHDRALISRRPLAGRRIDSQELRRRLSSAEAAVEGMSAAVPESGAPALTGQEAALLDAAGLAEASFGTTVALEKSHIAYDLLVCESVSMETAAEWLGVKESRLRQRLGGKRRTGPGCCHDSNST
jgi:hypothetical protein